ncbi:hypothetical protein E2562_028939, partial [Oryza meyeriana var. granulata]
PSPPRRHGQQRHPAANVVRVRLLVPPLYPCRAQATIFASTIDGKESTTFSFPKFDKYLAQLAANLTFSSNATVTQDGLQITPDNGNKPEIFLVNQAGRVFFTAPFVVRGRGAGHREAAYYVEDNHVGLDINGVRSTAATPLTPFGIQLAPRNTTDDDGSCFVCVDYNGTSWQVTVYMAKNEAKPSTAVLNASLDLSTILLGKTAYFGFTTGAATYQLNCVRMWNLTFKRLHDGSATTAAMSGWKLAVGVSCAVVVTLGLFATLYIRRRRNGTATTRAPRTNNFDEKMKLGQGGYGVVYRATMVGDDGRSTDVAVKQFSGANTKGKEDFLAELRIINCLRHRNLVKLPNPGERPRTQAILQILTGATPPPDVPPSKPAFMWPAMPAALEGDDYDGEAPTSRSS